MIEKIVLDYLTTALNVPVYMEKPANEETSEYVVLELVGNQENNRVCSASIAAQSYGASLYDAAELNNDVVIAMDLFNANTNIGGCKMASSYNFTDTASKRYRYQSVFDIYYVKEDSING